MAYISDEKFLDIENRIMYQIMYKLMIRKQTTLVSRMKILQFLV